MWQTKSGPIFADTGLDWDAPPSWRSPDGRPSEEQRTYLVRWDAAGIATPRGRLSQPESVDLDAMLALQNGRRSLAADAILAGVEEAMTAARGRRDDATAAAVLNLLAKWDRVVDARPVVSLSEAFEDALWRRTFVDEMDEALFRVFEHPLGGVAFLLAWFFNRGPVPIAGAGTAVMPVSWNRRRPFAAWQHSAWRQLLPAGQWDESRVSLPSGQSGHPLSPHHFEQNVIWREGRSRVQPFSRHRLLLTP